MSVIASIGTANPIYKRAQLETAELICNALNLKPAEKRIVKSIYRATGIEYRYSVLSDYCKNPGEFDFFPADAASPFPTTSKRMQIYKDNALNLALAAIENCLSTISDFDKSKITHLVTISCTGMYAPGIDIEIAQKLNLNPSIKRTVINFMGCYGAFNGIKIADAICRADNEANVLVVSVELCSIHFQKSMILDNLISNAIFADGAAAALIQHKSQSQSQPYLSLEDFYCELLPQTSQNMAWTIGDSGFDIILSSYVPEIIESGIAKFADGLLKNSHLATSDIDIFAIHPGGLKILQACEAALNISEEDNKHAYHVLKNYGNMSSATILFVLKGILDSLNKTDQDKSIFSCAFGPGLTLESMLLRAHCT